MSITFVQVNANWNGGSGTAPVTAAFTSANTAGNLLFVTVIWYSSTTTATATITDSQGNVYTPVAARIAFFGTSGYLQSFYCANCKAGANTVTLTLSASNNWLSLSVGEYSGVNTIDLVGPIVSGNSTSISSGASATTAHANELLIAYAGALSASGVTQGTGWTNQSNAAIFGAVQASQIVSSTGSYTATFTQPAGFQFGCGIASFYYQPPLGDIAFLGIGI